MGGEDAAAAASAFSSVRSSRRGVSEIQPCSTAHRSVPSSGASSGTVARLRLWYAPDELHVDDEHGAAPGTLGGSGGDRRVGRRVERGCAEVIGLAATVGVVVLDAGRLARRLRSPHRSWGT